MKEPRSEVLLWGFDFSETSPPCCRLTTRMQGGIWISVVFIQPVDSFFFCHRARQIAPVINVHGVAFERQKFEAKLSKGDVTLKRTEVCPLLLCVDPAWLDIVCRSGFPTLCCVRWLERISIMAAVVITASLLCMFPRSIPL